MAFVMWNPAWETGLAEIDDQHRALLGQIEALMAAVQAEQTEERIPGLLAFLADYVEVHFSTEERHMLASDYPALEAHRAIHDGMRARLLGLLQAHAEGSASLTEQLLAWLTDWLIGHIKDCDQPMARYLAANQVHP